MTISDKLKTAIGEIAKVEGKNVLKAAGRLVGDAARSDPQRLGPVEDAEADLIEYLAELEATTSDIRRKHIEGLIGDTRMRIAHLIDKHRIEAEWSGLDSRKALYESLRVAAEAAAPLVLKIALAAVKKRG
jgi:hypothetical protein